MPKSFAAGVSVVSAWVWRGFVLSDAPAVQPTAWVKAGPLTVTSWMNVGESVNGGHAFTEHDLTVDYSVPVGQATLSLGWTNYMFADLTEGRHSNEFYAGVAGGGFFSPALQVYHDVQEGHGTYAVVTVSHAFAIEPWKVSLSTPELAFTLPFTSCTVALVMLRLGVSIGY